MWIKYDSESTRSDDVNRK